ncbi:MAG: hypothetical protein K2X82_27790 [Gemmataceae bacterium]|nr:hypothetical protein [Gemmataceae bacterium]
MTSFPPNTPLPVLPPEEQRVGCGLLHRLGVRGCQRSPKGGCREFLLRVVQPGLVGLVDGSVSTLAPLFATAYATGQPRVAFLVGLAASVGAAISMGMSEGLSDDGALTGRGGGTARGVVTGAATFAGGILHTLPFLLPDVRSALVLAFAVVGLELLVISWIRFRFLDTPFWKSVVQVVVGGALVVLAGILLGSG